MAFSLYLLTLNRNHRLLTMTPCLLSMDISYLIHLASIRLNRFASSNHFENIEKEVVLRLKEPAFLPAHPLFESPTMFFLFSLAVPYPPFRHSERARRPQVFHQYFRWRSLSCSSRVSSMSTGLVLIFVLHHPISASPRHCLRPSGPPASLPGFHPLKS